MRKKLALSAFSILITLLFAEIALRILGIGATGRGSDWFAGGNHPRFLFQPDPESGYTLRPGFHGEEVSRGREFKVPGAIDGQPWDWASVGAAKLDSNHARTGGENRSSGTRTTIRGGYDTEPLVLLGPARHICIAGPRKSSSP